ncbi:multiple epidermal growth factor-like domains protein 8 [Anopheles funestus]|uniref:multiple epidermal growth factor-like domains protein 8 n=1 Tax=Anopheles funestus TaxID=62324 RepID=UPI0020C5B3A3|nr:multiple epidermal growth factor-like domains protein 8 [Anopheles funestus]
MEMNQLLSSQTTCTHSRNRSRPIVASTHEQQQSKQALGGVSNRNKHRIDGGTTMARYRNKIKKLHTLVWLVLLQLVLLPYVQVGLTLTKMQTRQSCDKTRRIFTQSYGEISDGPAGVNYTQDSHCEWLIRAQNDSQFITLKFRSMGTECSYDYIFIYDGDSFRSPLLGSFSGNTEPQHLIASSGSMLILLYSDTNYVQEGFRAEFAVTNCPNNCTGNGRCVDHACVCDRGWIGSDCSLDPCPDRCGGIESRGTCSSDRCECSKDYLGQACGLHRSKPAPKEWHWITNSKNGLPPRAAHTAVYYEPSDALYVFGGYNLNEVFDSLYVFRFDRNHWEDEWGIRVDQNYTEPSSEEEKLLRRTQFLEEESERLSREPNFLSNVIYTLSDNRTGIGYGEGLSNGTRPAGRYGHAASAVSDGFVIFGGKLATNGELANDLWLYNVSHNGGTWFERATESPVRPPALTRHTLTLAGEFLYVFGGAMEDGEFSSKLFRIKLIPDASDAERWEEVIPRGGKSLDVRMVAHTTSYQRATNSLIVYGGLLANVARFSRLSDRMFAFQLDHKHWAELQYPRTALHDGYAPRERAFHTTNIIGNYLIVFGGYSHKHNKEEICYDNQMYLYHLGCHSWINPEVLGPGPGSKYRYPKKQGVFAHAAAVRKGNTLLIVGGYHGNVNGDLLAYSLPLMLVVHVDVTFAPEAACPRHTSFNECLADLECGWCSADSVCYGRTIGANCTTNLQTTRCKGICSVLGDCHSCLVHGTTTLDEDGEDPGRKADKHLQHMQSIAHKLGLDRCTWCVQNARCHHKDDNYGVCGEDTPSQKPGWWGTKGTEVTKPSECTSQDKRPGLTFLKYLHPMNMSMPDAVMIVNATMADFTSPPTNTPTEQQLGGQVVARLLGFIRFPPMTDQSMALLQACVSHADAILRTVQVSTQAGRKGDTTANAPLTTLVMETMVSTNITANESVCGMVKWADRANILVDFQAQRNSRGAGGYYGGSGGHHHHHHGHHPDLSKMSLQHFYGNVLQAFTFEFLEPYSNGTACASYGNCLECLSDSSCGWCELTNGCLSRKANESETCRRGLDWRYLTIQPAHCSNCTNFVSCEQCIGHSGNQCEWWTEDATCARRGRSEAAVRTLDQCPTPCYQRTDCSACLNDRGRCVWCEATSQCFSFSVYTSEYQFGMCREWLDQTLPITVPPVIDQDGTSAPMVQQCKSCASFQNCSFCLRSLSCGWCYDTDNPINGMCMQGDFNRSTQGLCGNGQLLLPGTSNVTEPVRTSWAYAQCPDVDECELRLHDCHKQAECSNTHGSYSCKCRKGFVGDGVRYCQQTCYEACTHGHCSGAPDFRCVCDLGWTGVDCSVNCACNNHSTCLQGVGRCDQCLNWTEGEFCERCSPGSFGNATTEAGCQRCDCNGHGNVALGICDAKTGECYCQDYTEGLRCEMCNRNFYGDPKDGGQCYHQCASRGVLTQVGTQGLGSFQSYRSSWSGQETRECLWIVSPQGRGGGGAGTVGEGTVGAVSTELRNAIIQIKIEQERMNVTCGENAVYVYDGLPDLTGVAQQKQLIAVFCNEERGSWIAEARSGHLTVHFKKGPSPEQGFNAIYSVLSCAAASCQRPYHCTDDGRCVCPKGFTGPRCMMRICPSDCNEESKQGTCDNAYGRCICAPGYGGDDCSSIVKPSCVVFTELFNSYLVSDSFEHLRKTLPRFGHSLVADRRGSLWMFGGYSLSHGPLNDIRQFDTKNNTWMQVTVDSSPEDRMPQGRYYHAAEIIGSRQAIYVYGGLSRNGTLDDLWQFGLQTQRWSLVVPQNETHPPALAGHTLTAVGREELLLLIGGYTIGRGLQGTVWLFNLATASWTMVATHGSSPGGIYGHTAVYHAPSAAVYVYGGVRRQLDSNESGVSKRLYAFSVTTHRWTELPSFIYHGAEYVPPGRYLHSAVATQHYMLVFGGRSTGNGTDSLARDDVMVAYVYRCNQWIRLAKDAKKVGASYSYTYAQAMAQDPEGGSIYVVAGWDGSNHCRVTRIDLPEDMCDLWSGSKYLCRQYSGCSFCSVKGIPGEAPSHCYSAGGTYQACEGYNGTISFNSGASCDSEWIGRRACTSFKTCSTCLASYPWHGETESPCKWCPECHPMVSCMERSSDCGTHNGCIANQTALITQNECPGLPGRGCVADDCESCGAMPGCSWQEDQGGLKHRCREATIPTADEMDASKNDTRAVSCPLPCSAFKNCSTCVKHSSRPSECLWSTQLNECISPMFQPLYCSGGICGLIVRPNDPQHCPEPCASFTQCTNCLRHAYCGWCSRNGTDGDGVCTEGSVDGPANHPAGSTCAAIYQTRSKTPANATEPFGWNYFKCPPENECANGHHNCNAKSQRCVDHLHGYECVCAPGYNTSSLGGGGMCVPVCSQGCVRGACTEPDVCRCDFGYVGANCSIQCQCNGHSNCTGADQLDRCGQCHNNTMGAQCDKCLPFYVGDPRNGGSCVPCVQYCNGQTDLCIGRDQEATMRNMTRQELKQLVMEGPTGDAICLGCGNYTDGDQCETCVPGYFRKSATPGKACSPCECNGHGDMCDPMTGEKCNCGNNTESDNTCSSKGKNHAFNCWSLQCTKCRDSYSGHPNNGHQCYKHITVESRMCFDAKTIDECKIKPQPLKPGQTVFFVIQPRYMNVDIRFIVDVTQGELDFYMSPTDESFIVQTNVSTGHHDILLDRRYVWYQQHTSYVSLWSSAVPTLGSIDLHPLNIQGSEVPLAGEKTSPVCGGLGNDDFYVFDRDARDLITYETLNECKSLLRVFGLKNRLVVTLPHTVHALGQTKFYIALRARPGSTASYGLVFFRQDQLHIHLFVFFSVFFSCFFLFLALCVLAWKAKQAADMRRARRRHVVEMLHMAKRPFGRINLSLEGPSEGIITPAPHRRRGRTSKHSTGGSAGSNANNAHGHHHHHHHHHHQQQHHHQPDIGPIALEPTADNYAAVGTVFVRLPGKQKSHITLALASALIVMGRTSGGSYPSHSRAAGSGHHRRRSSPGGGSVCHASPRQHPLHYYNQQQQQQQQQLSLQHMHRGEPADVVGPLAERQPFIEVHHEQVPLQPLASNRERQ